SGDITINPSGNISSGAFAGIIAQITNAANGANIFVTPTGTVSGGNIGGGGGAITATTLGGGNVTVTTSNNVTANLGSAITTTTTSGTNTVNITGGIVLAGPGENAVNATAAGGNIVVNNAAFIQAGAIGVHLNGGTGSSVNNSGIISGSTGILATTGNASVFNEGNISGTGGTAIQFAGIGNTLTIAPTSVISGNAVGTGLDLLQLGGSGSGSFNSSLIGPAAQYRGFGAFAKVGDSTWTLSGTNSLVLPWTVQQGTLQVTGTLANSPFTVNGGLLSVGGTIGSATVNGGFFAVLAGGIAGMATVNGGEGSISGTVGPTTVNGGLLSVLAGGTSGPLTVNGGTASIAGSVGQTTINGGVVEGTGTVAGNVQVNNGGTFAPGAPATPGTSMFVTGSLAFQSGATYLIQANPSTASFANVVGTGALAGNVLVNFATGSYILKTYDILHASGGLTGTFAGVTSNIQPGFALSLSYTNTDVFLNLTAALGASSGLGTNQRNVGSAIDNFFNSGGALPVGFNALFGLSGSGLSNALGQISGEGATASQQTTFDAMSLFMGLMTDPFIGDRGVAGAPRDGTMSYAAGDALAYAGSGRRRSPSERDAYAAIYRKAPPAPIFEPGWSAWAAGFGGSQATDGNAALGSNDTTSRIAAGAVGFDYRFSPSTIAGFALAGGGTSFSVTNGGTGRSDLFQAGAFMRHTVGAAYIAAAAAYGWQDITTDRFVTVAGVDHLRAQFNTNAYSGRVEGGYRFVTPWVGLTPYAAGQFTTFDLPAYAESAVAGANTFALAYGAKSVTATRSEFGFRSDRSFAMPDGVLTLRGRLAWAHDFNPDRSIAATFQTLPGASFVVNGAAQAYDSALATASAELKWRNGWSAAATFEGEFSEVTRSYGGKGLLRYQW
ncbi:MAG: autotransporter domain-containing protein, partial [Gammaproteobacteria bacterium]|nr:autotransporter domain-containing protein [Gammaproteobacteria bacterium]